MSKKDDAVMEAINIAEVTSHKSGKGKPFWKAKTADDEYYTVWKEDIKDRLTQGLNYVMVDINDTGDMVFKNIVGIAPAPAPAPAAGQDFLASMGAQPQAAAPAAAPAPAPAPVQTPPPAAAVPAQPAPVPPPMSQPSQQYSNLSQVQEARARGLQVAAYMVAAGIITTVEMVDMAERNMRYILGGPGEQKSSSIKPGVDPADYVEK